MEFLHYFYFFPLTIAGHPATTRLFALSFSRLGAENGEKHQKGDQSQGGGGFGEHFDFNGF